MTTAPNHPTDDPDDDGRSPEHKAELPNQSTTGGVQPIGDDAGTLGTGASLPTIAAHLSSPESRKDLLIERYKLIEPIGEGGMGTVWRAQQVKPVRREVAVKLIKPGMDSKSVLARFDAERQALAIMDHPNIARVLDGGMADDGRPYFVMELVRGLPLTEYCDEKRLTIQQRLELFSQICSAVQHAHQKGIIHRDLKPSNILVTEVDGRPVPKVIDFGLAKALGSSAMLTEQTLHTGIGMVLGTPLYMAPEQMDAGELDIDTRADIYSLGVILYELLTGSTPFDRQKFKNAALDEIKRIVREEEPLKPSSRLSSIDTLPSVAATRQSEPISLHRIVRGELDWIVMKSLEKERHRRYDTANALSADVLRYLTGEMVTAAPPSTAYRIRKFVRKNRGPVIASSLLVLTLILGMAGTGWFAVEANRASNAAEKSLAMEADSRTLAEQRAAELLIEKQNVETERRKAEEEAQRATLESANASRERLIASEKAREAEAARREANDKAELAQLEAIRASEEADNAHRAQLAAESAREKTEAALARSNYFLANARWKEGRVNEALGLLHLIPEKFREFEWYLDNQTFQGSDVTLYGHLAAITDAAFAPDGSTIVSSSDATIRVWNAKTGVELKQLSGHLDKVTSLQVSADGKFVVSGSRDKTLKLWDLTTGELLQTFKGHTSVVNCVRFCPGNARVISCSHDKTILVWSVSDAQKVIELTGHTDHVLTVDCSPDGTLFVSGGKDGKLLLWNAETGELVKRLERNPDNDLFGNSNGVPCAQFSPDGSWLLSATKDGELTLWDTSTWKNIQGYVRLPWGVTSISINPGGNAVVVGCESGELFLCELNNKHLFQRGILRGHTHEITCTAYSPDGKLILSGSEDRTLKIWDHSERQNPSRVIASNSWVYDISFSADGARIVSAGTGTDSAPSNLRRQVRPLMLWDVENHRQVRAFETPTNELQAAVAFAPDALRIVAGGADKTLTIWNTESGALLHSVSDLPAKITSISVSPDGSQFLSADNSGNVTLWAMDTFVKKRIIKAHSNQITCVRFGPSGDVFATTAVMDGSVKLWNSNSGELIKTFEGHFASVFSVAFSPTGERIVSGGYDKVLRIWDVAKGTELRTLRGHSTWVSDASFDPSGTRIVSSALYKGGGRFPNGEIKLWDADSGQEIRTLETNSNALRVSFSPTGRLIAAAGWQDIRLWKIGSLLEMRVLQGDSRTLATVGFTPDGLYLVARDHMKRAICWSTDTWEMTAYDERFGLEEASNYSKDERWFAVPVGDSVRLVDLRYKKIDEVCGARKNLFAESPSWHMFEASKAKASKDWFAHMFHLAWQVKSQPYLKRAFDDLHIAHKEILKGDETRSYKLASLLPPAVKEALAMPRPSDSTVSESSAK